MRCPSLSGPRVGVAPVRSDLRLGWGGPRSGTTSARRPRSIGGDSLLRSGIAASLSPQCRRPRGVVAQ